MNCPNVRALVLFPSLLLSAQASMPVFSGYHRVSMTKDSTSVTLQVVRPLAHDSHPIHIEDASTNFVFATGPSTAGVALGQHGSNRGVSGSLSLAFYASTGGSFTCVVRAAKVVGGVGLPVSTPSFIVLMVIDCVRWRCRICQVLNIDFSGGAGAGSGSGTGSGTGSGSGSGTGSGTGQC
jgi:hypothetical protein